MLDLKAFDVMRQTSVRSFRNAPSFVPQTPEDLMKWEPDMPRVVAEYQVKKMSEGFRDINILEQQYAGIGSVDSLAALPVEQAAARWLEAQSSVYQTKLANRRAAKNPKIDCPEIADSVLKSSRPASGPDPVTVLDGTVSSDSLRYVIVADQHRGMVLPRGERPDEMPVMSPSVLMLRNVSGNWKVVPTYDMPHSDHLGINTIFAVGCILRHDSAASKK